MNYRIELDKVKKVLKEFIPELKAAIIGQKVSQTNMTAVVKELKKVNYRLDRLRSDLKLTKEKKVDVSNSSGIDNGCTESDK